MGVSRVLDDLAGRRLMLGAMRGLSSVDSHTEIGKG